MSTAVYEKLVDVARVRGTIGYRALAQVADVSLDGDDDIKSLGHILDKIADQETAAGRPLLPVIVLKDHDNMPGAGLFAYAKRKGLQKKKTDDLTFFAEELNRVYSFWASAPGAAKS